MSKISVLFVCLGNICRSPTAEAVFRAKLEQRNLPFEVEIDSAGTASWHVGKPPDRRMINAGSERGYDLSPLRARQVKAEDFGRYDYILAMDQENLKHLRSLRPEGSKTEPQLFLDYATGIDEAEVPDPYYGGENGFFHVIELIENASDGLLDGLAART